MIPLFPLKKEALKKFSLIGFDVETINNDIRYKNKLNVEFDAKTNDFYVGGLYTDDDEYLSFFNKEDMINHLLSHKYVGKLIVASNLGFDFNALFFNTPYWSKFKTIYSGSELKGCVYELSANKFIVFIDTFNFIKMSVKQMGKLLKKPKLTMPLCLGKYPKNDDELIELLEYNKRDCEISRDFMYLLQDTFNMLGGQLQMTIASTSLDIFRRKYLRFILKHETDICNKDDLYDFIFQAYYGGRTETFVRGRVDDATVYDVNSLYPSQMLKDYPYPHSAKYLSKVDEDIYNYVLKLDGVSRVNITSPKEMKYPYLPKKHKVDDSVKLIFPLGTWEATYTNYELRKALKLGYKINKIFESVIYTSTFFPFRNYVNDLYKLRLKFKSEKSPLEVGVKLCLNSLYGKFGQHHLSDVTFVDTREMNETQMRSFMTDPTRKFNMKDDFIGYEVSDSICTSSFVFPIFPIYTTAYARDVLYNYLSTYNALYCDTDSILTYDKLPTSNKLGEMKVEYDVLSGILIKPKMYCYKAKIDDEIIDIVKLKGVPKVTREVFDKILNGEGVTYTKFTKLKESLKREMQPNSIIVMKKNVSLVDNKRVWSNKFDPNVQESSLPHVIGD